MEAAWLASLLRSQRGQGRLAAEDRNEKTSPAAQSLGVIDRARVFESGQEASKNLHWAWLLKTEGSPPKARLGLGDGATNTKHHLSFLPRVCIPLCDVHAFSSEIRDTTGAMEPPGSCRLAAQLRLQDPRHLHQHKVPHWCIGSLRN